MTRIISPSILSADFGNLRGEIEMLDGSQARWIHLDIMDGVFVPNISFGFPVVEKVRELTDKVLDTHLMIVEPDRYIRRFREAGADCLTVQAEACTHLHRTLQSIREEGMKAGVALNPHTPLCMVEEILPEADLVLVMTVNPGFGGQKFIGSGLDKVRRLKEMILKKNAGTLIQVDGGVTADNAGVLFQAGADVLVAGHAVFSADDPRDMISRLLSV